MAGLASALVGGLVLPRRARSLAEADAELVARSLQLVALVARQRIRLGVVEGRDLGYFQTDAIHAFGAPGGLVPAVGEVALFQVFCGLVFAVLEPAGDEADDVLVLRVGHGHDFAEDFGRGPVAEVLLADADLLDGVGFLVQLVDRAVDFAVGAFSNEDGFLERLLELAVFERGLFFELVHQAGQLVLRLRQLLLAVRENRLVLF